MCVSEVSMVSGTIISARSCLHGQRIQRYSDTRETEQRYQRIGPHNPSNRDKVNLDSLQRQMSPLSADNLKVVRSLGAQLMSTMSKLVNDAVRTPSISSLVRKLEQRLPPYGLRRAIGM